jgi:uncharacterized protein YcbX
MKLSSIHLYPVKSCGGLSVVKADVEPWGLRQDRRWLVLKSDGSVLTAREQHLMLGVTARPLDCDAIVLRGRDGSSMQLEAPVDGAFVPTTLSRLESVRAAGQEANGWLSHQLGSAVRLGWLDDPRRRSVSLKHGGQPGDSLNLSDAGPVLLTTSASLRQLNVWIADAAAARGEGSVAPMVMDRFRPSVVIDGVVTPFAEDSWMRVNIGNVEFRFAEQCDRCALTTVDPRTLVSGIEPLRTLSRYRQHDHKTWFGVRLIPVSTGTIEVGDTVTAW